MSSDALLALCTYISCIYNLFLNDCLCCIFKAAEKCIKGKDAEYIQSSAERNPYTGKDGKQLIFPHRNELPHAQNSPLKKLIASDAVVPKTDAVIVTRREFPEPFGRGNTQKMPGKVPLLTGGAVEPTRHEPVLNKHHLIEPGTSGGSYGSKQRERTLGEMSTSAVFEDRLQCKVCGKRFQFESRVQRHMTLHTGEKPYMCSFCDKKFRSKYQHRMHELGHRGQLPQCPVCGGRYVCLSKHILIHSSDGYEHVCSVCQRAFRRARNLKRHMIVHTGERPYTCQDCGGRYRTSTYLKLHIRAVHAHEKNHVCSFCGKTFSHRVGLRAHMPVHASERPYRCETCDKAFKTKLCLATHRTIHSSVRPFVCSTCGKCFRLDCHLKRHHLIHTGEQPYECSMCKMRFNQSCSMQRHMLTHTGEKPYSCSDCGIRFTQSGGLASHRLRHCPNRRNTDS